MKIESKKYSRRFVISDIHGCRNTLVELVNKIGLQFDDALFFLGDYIDRGPDSKGVLDFIINLKKQNYNVFTIRGNHEQDFLEFSEFYDPKVFLQYSKAILKSSDLLKEDGRVKKRFLKLLKKTELYYELEDFILVHAGFNFKNENIYEDITAILNIRGWEFEISRTNGKKIVHGHQPTSYKKISDAISTNAARIPLDNGCVYTKPHKFYDYHKLGQLCCLNLDTMELISQKNIDI